MYYSRRTGCMASPPPLMPPFGGFPKVRSKQVARQPRGLLKLHGAVGGHGTDVSALPRQLPLLDGSVRDTQLARQAGPGARPLDGSNDGIGVHAYQNPTFSLVCQGQHAPQNQTDTFFAVRHPVLMTDDPLHADFARRLSLAMEEEGWPGRGRKARLHRELGPSETAVAKWIDGRGLPSMEHAVKLACLLNVCVEWLLTGRGDMRPPPPITDELRRHLENLQLLSPQHRQHVFRTGEVLTPTPETDRAA